MGADETVTACNQDLNTVIGCLSFSHARTIRERGGYGNAIGAGNGGRWRAPFIGLGLLLVAGVHQVLGCGNIDWGFGTIRNTGPFSRLENGWDLGFSLILLLTARKW
jgi:hypothetical protein